jgi:predicted nucleic acid-binding protein
MRLISCLDTHILIWGVKKQAKSTQHEMIDRTINFLQWLENEGHTILVPAPVLGEFLMRIPAQEHQAVTKVFEKRFVVSPYDVSTTSIFAALWQNNQDLHRISSEEDKPTREEVKVDCMIVAVALANKAHVIYSEDPHIQRISNGKIDVRSIPRIPRQPPLI